MRKLVVGALVGVLALAVAAIALADTTQTYSQKFTKSKAGSSVGTIFSTDSTDSTNSANNNQPKSVREFDIKFPAGTAVNNKAVPLCKASDDDMIQKGGKPACPKSVIGSGNAKVTLPFPGSAPVNATVTAFNAKKSLVLYVDPSPVAQAFILRPKFKGNLKNGPTLSTVVPPNCVPPATAQGGQCKKSDGSAGQEAILTHFDLTTKAKKKGKNILIRAPKKCKKSWTFKATLKYADGTSTSISKKQACKK
jgi:hypothetical protein